MLMRIFFIKSINKRVEKKIILYVYRNTYIFEYFTRLTVTPYYHKTNANRIFQLDVFFVSEPYSHSGHLQDMLSAGFN